LEGGNFIVTANVYQNGSSEKYVGEFIASERKMFVLATKYTLTTSPGDLDASRNHYKNLVQSVDASFKRLKTRYVNLLWVHIWDPMTPIEERTCVRSLDDLIKAGKILYIGISDVPAWVVSRVDAIAELRGWTPFIGTQIM
jgi:aryl-alcohol dehydrogenase-like predicted oxidoreductase